MKRSPINLTGILFEVALLTLALIAAITLIRIGTAVAAEEASTLPRVQATAETPTSEVLARNDALTVLQPNSHHQQAGR